jgi:hypothetical protein
MPAFHEMDMQADLETQERLHRALCDPVFMEEARNFEEWAAITEVAQTFWGKGDGPIWFQNRLDPGSSWRVEQDLADLMIAYYELPVGLYEKIIHQARQAGLRRRLVDKRYRRLQVAELKANAEW